MNEKELQSQIVHKLQTKTFWNLIRNKEVIDDILSVHFSEETLPYLSIDYLLKLNYYKGCKIVLDGLTDQESDNQLEILNGESIQNISMKKEELLYPDLLLYNRSNGKYIIGELKRSKSTERQAITELLGYELEIKNHLPLVSNADILLLLISFDYSALLQHSIETLILDHKSIMCLVPVIKNGQFECFDIFYPDCWTNTNCPILQDQAFQGLTYSISCKEHENLTEEDLLKLTLASAEYIKGHVETYYHHGFSVIWVPNDPYLKKVFITVFLINPYYIFYSSSNITGKGQLIKHINKSLDIYSLHEVNDKSVEFIFSSARKYLENSAIVTAEYEVNLAAFRKDIMYQGTPIQCDCWGEFGEEIRQAFLNNNIRKRINPKYIKYSDPPVFFKLLDLTTENYIFGRGFNLLYDFFQFGIKIGSINTLIQLYDTFNLNENGLPVNEEGKIDVDMIYWVLSLNNKIIIEAARLENSLQEIQERYNFGGGIEHFDTNSKQGLNKLKRYLLNTMEEFNKLTSERCQLFIYIGFNYCVFFDDFLWKLFEKDINTVASIQLEIIEVVYPIFCDFLWELITTKDIPPETELFSILPSLADVFNISYKTGHNGSHQLCMDFAATSSGKYNNLMNSLPENFKLDIMKKHFSSLLKQHKSLEFQKQYTPLEKILQKSDVRHLIQCIKALDKRKQRLSFIEIGEYDTVSIAYAPEESALAKMLAQKPDEKIAVYRQFGIAEFIEFVDYQKLL